MHRTCCMGSSQMESQCQKGKWSQVLHPNPEAISSNKEKKISFQFSPTESRGVYKLLLRPGPMPSSKIATIKWTQWHVWRFVFCLTNFGVFLPFSLQIFSLYIIFFNFVFLGFLCVWTWMSASMCFCSFSLTILLSVCFCPIPVCLFSFCLISL